MVTWLNLSAAVRVARNERTARWAVIAAGFCGCFILALIF